MITHHASPPWLTHPCTLPCWLARLGIALIEVFIDPSGTSLSRRTWRLGPWPTAVVLASAPTPAPARRRLRLHLQQGAAGRGGGDMAAGAVLRMLCAAGCIPMTNHPQHALSVPLAPQRAVSPP